MSTELSSFIETASLQSLIERAETYPHEKADICRYAVKRLFNGTLHIDWSRDITRELWHSLRDYIFNETSPEFAVKLFQEHEDDIISYALNHGASIDKFVLAGARKTAYNVFSALSLNDMNTFNYLLDNDWPTYYEYDYSKEYNANVAFAIKKGNVDALDGFRKRGEDFLF